MLENRMSGIARPFWIAVANRSRKFPTAFNSWRALLLSCLAEEGDAVGGILLLALDEVAGLDEHAAGAAGGIEDDAVVRLDHVDDGLDEGGRGEELAVILRALHGELHEEVLVDAAEDVASGGAESFAVEDAQEVFEHGGSRTRRSPWGVG